MSNDSIRLDKKEKCAMRTEIVITGIGAVTPFGAGVDALWGALLRGESAISDMDLFDLGGIACTRAGVIRDLCSGAAVLRPEVPQAQHSSAATLPRATRFAALAAQEALEGVPPEVRRNLAIITASNFGDMDVGENALCPPPPVSDDNLLKVESSKLNVECSIALPPLGNEHSTSNIQRPTSNNPPARHCAQAVVADALAEAFGLGGPRLPISLSCSSGASAIATAANLIEAGHIEGALVVGYDALSRYAWSGLCSLRTMTKDAVRPFDINRGGTIFAEGAAALIIQRIPQPTATDGHRWPPMAADVEDCPPPKNFASTRNASCP